MVASVTAVLKRVKMDWATQLQPEAIIAACEEAGDTSWRERVLTPVTTIQLFLLQILHGNTACNHLTFPFYEFGLCSCDFSGNSI
jgi:hypothetical protein